MVPPLNVDVSLIAITTIFRVYLADQTMEHLSATLKRGGIKDLLAFFPVNKRYSKTLDAHFREAGLPQVADWFAKRQYAAAKEVIVRELKELIDAEESSSNVSLTFYIERRICLHIFSGQIIDFIKEQQATTALPEAELIQCIWQGIMNSIDWSARPDQIDALAVREITVRGRVTETSSPSLTL
jgi:hypothetical protein